MTPQATFMICAPIIDGQRESLQHLLSAMNNAPGQADPKNTTVPFYQFSRLHLARFVIIENTPLLNNDDEIRHYGVEPSDWKPMLAFLGDVDGSVDLFLAELALRAGPGLREVFSHCADFDKEQTDLLQWMKQRNKKPTANYVNWRGRTVVQIKEEQKLAHALKKKLEEIKNGPEEYSLQGLRKELVNYVEEQQASGELIFSKVEPTPIAWVVKHYAHLILVPLVLLILFPVILIGSPFYLFYLRRLEKTDFETDQPAPIEHVRQISSQEDIDVTNHFNVFGMIKPGRFRFYTISFLLFMLDYACRHVYFRGFLTRIKTIHFARWVIMDSGRRVYFASNYDGSADSYMDDFINKVAWGLNLVFSNGVGYPRSRWLVKGGAEYEEKYKRKLRRSQLPSESWYRAYPGMTAVDLERNTHIREGLEAEKLNNQQIQRWLALLY